MSSARLAIPGGEGGHGTTPRAAQTAESSEALMIHEARWANFTTIVRRKILADGYTFIPSNRHGIEPGYYSAQELVMILRRRKAEKGVVQFILDMLE